MIAKARILIVENQSIIAKDLEKILEKLGYAVSAMAFSGEEAIRKAEEDRPDLVLTEVVLDGKMDGIEAASHIYSRFSIPVIFLTAVSDSKTIERAKVIEPYGYIIKPFEEESLHATLEMALHKHRMQVSKSEKTGDRPAVTKENHGARTSEAGLKAEWTRATFIVKKEHLEKIKAMAYWERKKVKDVMEEALDSFIKDKETDQVRPQEKINK